MQSEAMKCSENFAGNIGLTLNLKGHQVWSRCPHVTVGETEAEASTVKGDQQPQRLRLGPKPCQACGHSGVGILSLLSFLCKLVWLCFLSNATGQPNRRP